MNRRLRIAFFCGTLVLLTAMGAARLRFEWGKNHPRNSGVPEGSSSRTAFVLNENEWLTFRIPSATTQIKLLSRANLAGTEEELVDRDFPYEVRYRLESLSGRLFSEGTWALRTQVLPMVDQEGRPARAARYRAEDFYPALAKTSIVEPPSGEIALLRLRAGAARSPVKDLVVRLYTRQDIAQHRVAYLWDRLDAETRDFLLRNRVHGKVDLTATERLGVLRNLWKALGPQGIPKRDYEERTLYIQNDLLPEKRQLIEPFNVGEILCGPDRRAIIGLPGRGKVRLRFRLLDENAGTAVIRFFGEAIHERETYHHPLDSDFSADLGAGMIEVESQAGAAITPFLLPVDQSHEERLLQEPNLIRSWICAPGEPVEFRADGNAFFRLSARPLENRDSELTVQFLDRQGSLIRSVRRPVPHAVSMYDARLTARDSEPVSAPVDIVFSLSDEVSGLRLGCDAPVSIQGYTRPASMPHRTHVPEDYLRAVSAPDRQPLWFGLRPNRADDLIRGHRSAIISHQVQPPEDDTDILAGRYEWEGFQPENDALGQFLLVERSPEVAASDEAIGSLFRVLPMGMEFPLELSAPPGLELPARRLVFLRSGASPALLRLWVDGKLHLERQLLAGRGEILLPPLPPGSRVGRVESDAADMQCLLNYVQPDTATKFKRLAQRFQPGASLSYRCEKITAEDELLTGRFFAPLDTGEPVEIHLSIYPGQTGAFLSESEMLTPRERIYYLTPDGDTVTQVLGGPVPEVDGGRRFFIPLGDDLGPGDYRVVISLRDGPAGYLTLSKVTGGDFTKARFFREGYR